MFTTKKYVGMANALPDSFTPLRLPPAMISRKKIEMGSTQDDSGSTAEASAAAPAAADTAAVSTYPNSSDTPATWARVVPKLSLVTMYAPPAEGYSLLVWR